VRHIYKKALCIALLLLPLAGSAQQHPHYSLSLTGGYTVPNSSEYNYIASPSLGIDALVTWRQRWAYLDADSAQHNIRPRYNLGVRASFSYFPHDIAGQRFGLAGFVQEPLWHRGANVLALELDFGLACYTNPYERTPNPDNVFIGSYINSLIHVGLVYGRGRADGSSWSLAGKLVHCSNGYLKKPNRGLNYLQLEFTYGLPESPERRRRATLADGWSVGESGWLSLSADSLWNRPSNDLLLSYAPGFVLPRYENRGYYYAHTARIGWQHRFNCRHAAGMNIDLTYNYSYDAINRANHVDYPLPFFIGLCGNYEATWHRLFLHVGLAGYLARSPKNTSAFYERVGLFYYLGKSGSWDNRRFRHFVGVSLKSHAAHIDFIEWHYGIKFRMKK